MKEVILKLIWPVTVFYTVGLVCLTSLLIEGKSGEDVQRFFLELFS